MTIDTNPPSGTRDFLADDVARRERAFTTVRHVFERHGFEPLDTPAFERLEVLLGKYGEEGDKLVFKILRRGEHEQAGEADLALRYDLTVPLARVVAQHADRIVEPYKRYHLAPVWRAERAQRGRYREFVQCDVDVVGSSSPLADAEVIVTVVDALAALGLGDVEVRLNSREALRGLIEAYDVPEGLEDAALVALDKLDKVGPDGVAAELRDRGVPAAAVEAMTADLAEEDAHERIRDRVATTERGKLGLAEVDDVLALVAPALATGSAVFAPLLARGLSYYTGPIFETFARGLDSAIASGGRYDRLVGVFSNRDIPATGGSIGLERVLLLGGSEGTGGHAPDAMVAVFDDDARGDALAVARRLRDAGLHADVYVGSGRLGRQLRYADRRGIRYCVLRGSDERATGTAAVKDLRTGEQSNMALDDLPGHLHRLLRTGSRP